MEEHCGQGNSKKYERTSQEQLDHYLHFLQVNPDFFASKNDTADPSKMKAYWNVLAKELNTLRGPVRPMTKWKQTLSHWKHQLRSRTRKIKVYKNLTGGSPPPSEKIISFEERALEVFGAVALDGLQTVPTIGCDVFASKEGSIESSPATPISVSSFTFEDDSSFFKRQPPNFHN